MSNLSNDDGRLPEPPYETVSDLDALRAEIAELRRRLIAMRPLIEMTDGPGHRYGVAFDEDECWGDDRCPGCRFERLKREGLAYLTSLLQKPYHDERSDGC